MSEEKIDLICSAMLEWGGGRKRGIGPWEDFFVIPTANLVVSQENLSENGRLGCHAIACATVPLSSASLKSYLCSRHVA